MCSCEYVHVQVTPCQVWATVKWSSALPQKGRRPASIQKAHPLAQKIKEQLTLNSNFLSTQQYFVSTCEWHRLKNTLSKV